MKCKVGFYIKGKFITFRDIDIEPDFLSLTNTCLFRFPAMNVAVIKEFLDDDSKDIFIMI